MARSLPALGEELVMQIEEAWHKPQLDWCRKRLLVVRLISEHQHSIAQIMEIAGVSRQSIFNYRDKVVTEGVEGLLKREWAGARQPVVTGQDAIEFTRKLAAGDFRQARDAQKWITRRTSRKLTEGGVRKLMNRLGGKPKLPHHDNRKKDQAAADAAVDAGGAPIRVTASDPPA
jgi:transposase